MYVICNDNQYNIILQRQETKQSGLQRQQLYSDTTMLIRFLPH